MLNQIPENQFLSDKKGAEPTTSAGRASESLARLPQRPRRMPPGRGAVPLSPYEEKPSKTTFWMEAKALGS